VRHEGRLSAVDLFLSFLIGGVVGAGLALLLAPQPGREMRKRIKEFPGEAKEYVEDVKGRVKSTVEKGKEVFENKKSALSKAVEAGKEAYKKETE